MVTLEMFLISWQLRQKIRNRDGKNSDPGSVFRDKHPGSAALTLTITVVLLYLLIILWWFKTVLFRLNVRPALAPVPVWVLPSRR